MSRIQAGRIELSRADADLAEVTRSVVRRAREQATAAGSESRSRCRPSRGMGLARVEQAVGCLVTNALKYGEGRPIEWRCAQAGTAPSSPCGIGRGHRVFRASRASSSASSGLLDAPLRGARPGPLLRPRIIEAHGGTIRVASAPGEGAKFTIHLPSRPRDVRARAGRR